MHLKIPSSPKILIARGDVMGDVILSTVVIKPLKKKYPKCKIYFLVKKEYFPLLEPLKEIEGLIEDPIPYDLEKKHYLQIFRLAKKLNQYNFDIFIGLWEKSRYALLSKLSGISFRIGHGIGFSNRFFYNYYKNTDLLEYTKHQAEWNLSLLEFLGIKNNNEPAYLEKADFEEQIILKKLPIYNTNFCCLALDAKTPQKRITEKQYSAIVDYLIRKKKIPVVLIGQRYKSVDPEFILKANNRSKLIFDMTDQLDLKELTTVISKSYLFFGPDTGLAHLSAAFKRKSIVYFLNKTQNIMRWGPWRTANIILKSNPDCEEACDSIACKKLTCRELALKEVFKSIDLIISKVKIDTKDVGFILNDETQTIFPLSAQEEKLYRIKKGLNIGIIGTNSSQIVNNITTSGWSLFEIQNNLNIKSLSKHIIKNNLNLILLYKTNYKIKYWLARQLSSNSIHFFTKLHKVDCFEDFENIVKRFFLE